MKPSKSLRRTRGSGGFTLIETIIAVFILSVGLLSVAAVMSKMTTMTSGSQYQNTEAMLATEKLEDLNRYSVGDPHVCIPNGVASMGSLTADSTNQNITCPPPYDGNTAVVDYSDTVRVSVANGTVTEIYSVPTGYMTTQVKPDGSTPPNPVAAATAPAPDSATLIINRRWVIEKDQPVAGVRRVTVLVQLGGSEGRLTSTQPIRMSMVRP